jgi:hypothetical protein
MRRVGYLFLSLMLAAVPLAQPLPLLAQTDTTPPTITFVQPVSGLRLEGAELEVKLYITDVGSGIDPTSLTVRLRKRGSVDREWREWVDISSEFVFLIDGAPREAHAVLKRGEVPQGHLMISAEVKDRAGLVGRAEVEFDWSEIPAEVANAILQRVKWSDTAWAAFAGLGFYRRPEFDDIVDFEVAKFLLEMTANSSSDWYLDDWCFVNPDNGLPWNVFQESRSDWKAEGTGNPFSLQALGKEDWLNGSYEENLRDLVIALDKLSWFGMPRAYYGWAGKSYYEDRFVSSCPPSSSEVQEQLPYAVSEMKAQTPEGDYHYFANPAEPGWYPMPVNAGAKVWYCYSGWYYTPSGKVWVHRVTFDLNLHRPIFAWQLPEKITEIRLGLAAKKGENFVDFLLQGLLALQPGDPEDDPTVLWDFLRGRQVFAVHTSQLRPNPAYSGVNDRYPRVYELSIPLDSSLFLTDPEDPTSLIAPVVEIQLRGPETFGLLSGPYGSGVFSEWVYDSVLPVEARLIYRVEFPPLSEVKGKVSYERPNQTNNPLPDVQVQLLRATDGSVFAQTVADAQGNYHFPNVPDGEYRIKVVLRDAASSTPTFEVVYGQEASVKKDPNTKVVTYGSDAVVFVESQPFVVKLGDTIVKDIVFGDSDTEPLVTNVTPRHRLNDVAAIYYHTRQAKLLTDRLRLALDASLPVGVIAFSPWEGVFWSPSGGDPYINIAEVEGNSEYSNPDRPDNREWHEFSHHIMADSLIGGDNAMPSNGGPWTVDKLDDNRNGVFNELLLAVWLPDGKAGVYDEGPINFNGDINHWGYVNPSTTDSLTEGFAEFLSMVIADEIANDPRPSVYKWSGGEDDLERPYFAWRDEEFAVASILWDLYDSNADHYNYKSDFGWNFDVTLNDNIDLSLDELWSRLNQTTIKNLKDVYDAFSYLNGDSDGDGVGDLDELFIMNGVFADTAPFKEYNGEEVGRAAYDRPITFAQNALRDDTFWFDDGDGVLDAGDRNPINEKMRRPPHPTRRAKPPRPGSFLRLTAIDARTGAPIDEVELFVEIKYAPPYGASDYQYSLGTKSLPAEVPISLPSIPSEARIVAKKAGYEDSAPLVIDSGSYWEGLVEGGDYLLVHTFELAPTPIPGDVNRDWVVNFTDLFTVAGAFNTVAGDPDYNPAADLDGNDVIDILDLVQVAVNFGHRSP